VIGQLSGNGFKSAENFADALARRINTFPLPGLNAQLKMASDVRNRDPGYTYDTSSASRSRVLILLYPADQKLKTALILRPTYDGVHSGQVSFPGGRVEPQDDSLIATALRESFEEVGILPDSVRILGTLSELYIPPSNFLVLPILGFTGSRPDFRADPGEVAEIIETDLEFLFDDNYSKETILNLRGYTINAPYFDVGGHIVWGATAMILSELKEVIGSLEQG
jgi:8-oxo-dGTP pyrophosphatase MutT (NUDIX family)